MHASETAASWEAFLRPGSETTTRPAPHIQRSWQRCETRSQHPESPPRREITHEPTRSQEILRDLARPWLEDLYQFVEGSGFAVLLYDAELTLIDLIGDPSMLSQIEQLGLGLHTSWQEERIGTMAVNVTLAEAAPCQTAGSDHFYRAYQPFACSAAPLFQIEGQTAGVLGVLGLHESAHAHTLGMVIAAAQSIEAQSRSNVLLAETNDHLAELSAVIEAMSEGILVIDLQGNVSRMNARAAQMLGLSARAAAGRPLAELLALPAPLRAAIERRQSLADQELLFSSSRGPVAALCSLRPVVDPGRHYRGALLTLRPPESVQRLVHQVVGTQARFTFADIVGESPVIQAALRHARVAAYSAAPVMLEGEAGVGKELFAHALHNAGPRAEGPFLSFNCEAIPRSLLLGELVGYEDQDTRNQHTQAGGRPGKLELAQGGTLLLEQVGALTPEAQTSLLRVIETGHLIRLGGRRVVPMDVRLITTTNSSLQALVKEGRFRPELLLRLGMLTIHIPTLRERGDDVLLLVTRMLAAINQRLGKQAVLAPEALTALCAYPWPGNVRELEACLERPLHLNEKTVIGLDDLPRAVARYASSSAPAPHLRDRQALAEREAILRACRETGGHLGRAADKLGISRATLWRKMKQYQIERDQLLQ